MEVGGEQQLVAWIVTRSSGEIKRIVSGSDISSLTDTRFASLCKGSLVRINSLLDGGGRKDLSADLEARPAPLHMLANDAAGCAERAPILFVLLQ